MSLVEYWNACKHDLEKLRGWSKSTAKGQSTLEYYDKLIDRMAKACPRVMKDIPIVEVTYRQLMEVLECVRNMRPNKPYADSTVETHLSVLGDIFRYAESQMDAINPLTRYTFPGSSRGSGGNNRLKTLYQTILNPAIPERKRKELVIKTLEEKPVLRRSLTPEELYLLTRAIITKLKTDGRIIGLALALWLGVRPSECLALRWTDIKHYPGKPGCYIEVRRKLDVYGRPHDALKSENAYRRIPIHNELLVLLEDWKAHIRQCTGKEPEGYICCFQNQFGKPCTYPQFEPYVKNEIFGRLNADFLADSALQMAMDDMNHSEMSDELDSLTLYVLRRNFWTYLQAGSQLDTAERRYVMGHRMDDIKVGLRKQFNDLDRLWSIGEKMNRVSFSPDLSESIRRDQELVLSTPGALQTASDVGEQTIRIPGNALNGKTVLELTAATAEPGDDLILTLESPVRGAHTVDLSVEAYAIPDPTFQAGRLNMEYDLKRLSKQAKKRKPK